MNVIEEAAVVYRIRYQERSGSARGEALVEANSPAEAMVKFRCGSGALPRPKSEELITSVSADAMETLNGDLGVI